MRLDEYQWSHNPRGMHNAKAATYFDVPRLVPMKMGWGKIVAVDREFMPSIAIESISRLWLYTDT